MRLSVKKIWLVAALCGVFTRGAEAGSLVNFDCSNEMLRLKAFLSPISGHFNDTPHPPRELLAPTYDEIQRLEQLIADEQNIGPMREVHHAEDLLQTRSPQLLNFLVLQSMDGPNYLEVFKLPPLFISPRSAEQILRPQNFARLGQNGLLGQLTAMLDKEKALSLAAHAAEVFPGSSGAEEQQSIIESVIKCTRPLTELEELMMVLPTLCTNATRKSLPAFTTLKLFRSRRSVSEIKRLRQALEPLLRAGMSECIFAESLRSALCGPRALTEMGEGFLNLINPLFRENADIAEKAPFIALMLECTDSQIMRLLDLCEGKSWEERRSCVYAFMNELAWSAALERVNPQR